MLNNQQHNFIFIWLSTYNNEQVTDKWLSSFTTISGENMQKTIWKQADTVVKD